MKKDFKKESLIKVANESYYGTGKRKRSIAKVWLFKGTGKASINNKTIEYYLGDTLETKRCLKPLDVVGLTGKYDIKITVVGGGVYGQSDAIVLGISRALLELNPTFRSSLKEHGFLTRDSRVKERKKYGLRKARKAPQYRKR